MHVTTRDLQTEMKGLLETTALTTTFDKFIAWGRKKLPLAIALRHSLLWY